VRVGIIGGGFMGEAFLRGIIRSEFASPAEIAVAEKSLGRHAALAEHGVRVTDDAESACIGADMVLIAVKPQDLPAVAQSLRGNIPPSAVFVSIAAGVPLGEVQRHGGHRASVRVMPNMPVAAGEGAAVFLVADEVTQEQRSAVQRLLEGVCTAVVEVADDEAVDLATALHASGPAYIYLVIEAMVDAAVRLGMKRPDASALALATVVGAARYAIETGAHPAELKNAVTSPGGTTAAALRELEAAGLRTAFDDAIEAAFLRAQDLGEMS
jgi:pyrroline-5-carboxylate reductase